MIERGGTFVSQAGNMRSILNFDAQI